MFKKSILAAALATAFVVPSYSIAADEKELTVLRDQINQMKLDYEARMQALEKRLMEAEQKADNVQAQTASASIEAAPAVQPRNRIADSGFNPAIALSLNGTLANLSQDPGQYRLQGFMPNGGEIGPGERSFNLGESELTFSANIDPRFAGQLTFALGADDSVGVEEAFIQTRGLSNGLNLKAGRFLSSIGYLNNQHAHAWDFVDAPLAYQAFFGGQYRPDGVQLKWLAPTDLFVELGAEADNGRNFPGNDRNKNGVGATTIFAHVGDDIGASASWRAGLSYMGSRAEDRAYEDIDRFDVDVTNAFSGKSRTWVADAVFKWAPNGNPTDTNFKLQGEYFRRKESGSLAYDTQAQSLGTDSGSFSNTQSGWYVQSIYQFMPQWRAGLRYDKLSSGSPNIGLISNGSLTMDDFLGLAAFGPSRSTLMLDYSPSEFSRFRLQLARDKSQPGAADKQIFLQYIMNLGAHGAHSF